MLLLLIFPVLVAGFFACHIHPVYSYKLHRYVGQYLYLKSAELGIKCFAIGASLALLLHVWLPDEIQVICITLNTQLSSYLSGLFQDLGAKNAADSLKTAWFFILSITTFLAAFIVKWWGFLMLRLRFGTWESQRCKIYVIGEILADSPLDNLLFELSLATDKYAMISLEDRKVYVGKVIDMGEPTETNGIDQDISIMPLMSGHRGQETLEVTFTTSYDDVESDIYLSLRQDKIIAVTEFDFDAYKTWNAGARPR